MFDDRLVRFNAAFAETHFERFHSPRFSVLPLDWTRFTAHFHEEYKKPYDQLFSLRCNGTRNCHQSQCFKRKRKKKKKKNNRNAIQQKIRKQFRISINFNEIIMRDEPQRDSLFTMPGLRRRSELSRVLNSSTNSR